MAFSEENTKLKTARIDKPHLQTKVTPKVWHTLIRQLDNFHKTDNWLHSVIISRQIQHLHFKSNVGLNDV